MAATIGNLMDNKVEVTMTEASLKSAKTSGVLRSTDERGILLTAEDPKDGPIRIFVPWSAIAWIRATGSYEPRKTQATSEPAGL
jgi:hypothetical protein